MNRLKLWLFALVVVAAAGVAVHLHTRTMRADALAAADARLDAAAQQVIAATGALAHDAAAAAALVARDPGLVQALAGAGQEPATRGRRARGAPATTDPSTEQAATERAGRAALGAAERALGFRLPDGASVIAATRESLAPLEGTAGDAAPLLLAAAEGASPRGHVLVDGKLHYAAAAPAGDGRGVLVLAPVGEAFARGVAVASGLPVLLVAPGAKPIVIGNLPTADQPVVVEAARVIGVRSDAGRLGPVDLGGGGAMAAGAMKLPKVPLLGGAAPAYRVHAVGLEGVEGRGGDRRGPHRAASRADRSPAVAGRRGARRRARARGAVRPSRPRRRAAADVARVARLGCGADREGRLRRARPRLRRPARHDLGRARPRHEGGVRDVLPRPPAPVEEAFARAARPAEADPSAFEFPPRPSASDVGAAEESGTTDGAAVLPPPPEPALPPRAAAIVPPPPPADEPLAAPAELLQAAAQSAPPEDDEQGHWRQVFSDFLRTRGECGEPAGGVTFERFAQKLASNKAALVSKYACRTVRFQVYVKDGKAALKATPVK